MSKVDAQRAMREARYAARASGGSAAAGAPAPAGRAAPDVSSEPRVPPAAPAAAEPRRGAAISITAATTAATEGEGEVEVCGHRNLSNKSCQRPAGHAEKSHRYR